MSLEKTIAFMLPLTVVKTTDRFLMSVEHGAWSGE
jgi:hypothetical protein